MNEERQTQLTPQLRATTNQAPSYSPAPTDLQSNVQNSTERAKQARAYRSGTIMLTNLGSTGTAICSLGIAEQSSICATGKHRGCARPCNEGGAFKLMSGALSSNLVDGQRRKTHAHLFEQFAGNKHNIGNRLHDIIVCKIVKEIWVACQRCRQCLWRRIRQNLVYDHRESTNHEPLHPSC